MQKFIDINQLSELLGVKVPTIYGWIYSNEIPFYKIGRLVRFDSKEIDEWLETKHCGGRKRQTVRYKSLVDKI